MTPRKMLQRSKKKGALKFSGNGKQSFINDTKTVKLCAFTWTSLT